EESPVLHPYVQPIAADEKRHRAAVADRFIEPHGEDVAQRREQTPQPRDRKPPAPEIGQYLQLEDVERRVTALRESSRLSAMGRHRGLEESPGIPPLQLARREPREPDDFPRRVVLLQLHRPNRSGRINASSAHSRPSRTRSATSEAVRGASRTPLR